MAAELTGPAVAQLYEAYLGRTETFLYSYLTGFRSIRPIVFSRRPFINLEEFPFSSDAMYTVTAAPEPWRRLPAAILWKAIGRSPREELRIRYCERLFRRHRVSLMHAHFGTTAPWSLALKRRTGIRLITSFYGFDTRPDLGDAHWPEVRASLFEQGDGFLVEGPVMRERLTRLGCPGSKIHIQRIAVHLDRLPFRYRYATAAPPIILFSARFVEKKGFPYALEAVSRLYRSGYRFEFRVIGDGPQWSDYRTMATSLGLGDQVRFLGALPHEQYIAELDRATIFLQPSVTAANGDNEGGAPTSVLEAQACGLPVVATTHADIPNIVDRDRSALLAPERDARALADALACLLDHPESWARMGSAGREFVAAFHDIRREAPALEAVYRRFSDPAMR